MDAAHRSMGHPHGSRDTFDACNRLTQLVDRGEVRERPAAREHLDLCAAAIRNEIESRIDDCGHHFGDVLAPGRRERRAMQVPFVAFPEFPHGDTQLLVLFPVRIGVLGQQDAMHDPEERAVRVILSVRFWWGANYWSCHHDTLVWPS